MLTTRLCRELAIEHPILSAPLGGGIAGPELAAAVSEAGGLGLLGMGGVPARVIREHIRDTRRRTSKPFGADSFFRCWKAARLKLASRRACRCCSSSGATLLRMSRR